MSAEAGTGARTRKAGHERDLTTHRLRPHITTDDSGKQRVGRACGTIPPSKSGDALRAPIRFGPTVGVAMSPNLALRRWIQRSARTLRDSNHAGLRNCMSMLELRTADFGDDQGQVDEAGS